MIKEEILKILKSHDDFISGQSICDRLSVSRTAVWKAITSLKADGYDIEAVTNRGYHLIGDIEVIDVAALRSKLVGNHILETLEYKKTVDSTNRLARDYAESKGEYKNKKPQMPALFIADEQSAGRGRRGRSWVSKKGSGIWMSFLIKPDIPTWMASVVTLVAAMAVCESVNSKMDVDAQIKWPNDLVIDGRKICGILTEMTADTDGIRYIVVGIGINANHTELPEELADTATTIEDVTGKQVDRTDMITDISNTYIRLLTELTSNQSFTPMKERYESMSINIDKQVTVLDPAGEYEAHAVGIDDMGGLMVRLEDGSERHIISGEVSVRGIYGHYA